MRAPLAVLISLVALHPAVAQRPDRGERGDRGPRRESAPVELKHLTFEEKAFQSEAIGGEAQYGVYLPKDHGDPANADTTYPLVIWLHGMNEDHRRFHGRGMGAQVLDQVVGEGKLPPCVFVLANGGRRSMYINRGPGNNFEDLVTKDLLDHVTATYRVSKDRNQRALMGISMGGMGALRIGFTRPELFGTIAVHSSAVLPEDPEDLPERMKQMVSWLGLTEVFGDPIDPAKWRLANPLNLAEDADPKRLNGLRLYFDAGTNDRYRFADANQRLHEVLVKKEVPHSWTLVQDGGHAWGSGFQEASLAASLSFVGEGLKAAAAADKGKAGLGGLLEGGKGDGKAPAGPPKTGGDGR